VNWWLVIFCVMVAVTVCLMVAATVSAMRQDKRHAVEPLPFPDDVDRAIRRAGVKACRDCEDTR
jgi:hypothetical protein